MKMCALPCLLLLCSICAHGFGFLGDQRRLDPAATVHVVYEEGVLHKGEGAQKLDLTVGDEARQVVESETHGVDGSDLEMVSVDRKMATVNLALQALSVPGDFVETGVYTGGTAILMAKVLKSRDSSRRLWAADSFAGLPKENKKEIYRQQHLHQKVNLDTLEGHRANVINTGDAGDFSSSRSVFERNLENNGLGNSTTNPQIKVLQGWFKDTLPAAPIKQIAFLRLDGDIYASTYDTLKSLYKKVVPGGYIYVDDYGSFIACKHAVDHFRQKHGITAVMHPISECDDDCSKFEAVWWRKD